MISRKPPKKVLEQLRKEVNFGCPVCGIPYLTWHHFDPPWHEKPHHNPDGMIALCPTHASLADGGRWTNEQLREMKRNPFISSDKISETYGYLRKDVVCRIGGIFGYKTNNMIVINGERVIGFRRDGEGYNRLNVLIRDSNNNPILVMEDNFWTANINRLYDLRCSARGKELEIISKDKTTRFKMRFDEYPSEKFKELILEGYENNMPRSIELSSDNVNQLRKSNIEHVDKIISMINLEVIPIWSINGILRWKDIELNMSRHQTIVNNSITFTRGFVYNSKCVLCI